MASVTSGGGHLPPPDPSAASRPPKSFIDAINTSHSSSASVPVKPFSSHRGEPAVFFSKDEIEVMAKPFKLSLIGKFSFGRPPMDIIRQFFVSLGLKGNSQVSLLDQRHVLINLFLEEDYTRVWLRQSWYIKGRSMRMFKWTTSFRCSEESSIVPVWISLPFLPIHFVNYKQALHSIAAAVGKPLRVDHATAAGKRPSVARVLVEYDISQALLPPVWIGEGDEGFWQDIIFEKVPLYCHSCKHLGHDPPSCHISNPELRVPWRNNKAGQASNKAEQGKPDSGKSVVDTAKPTIKDVAQHMHTLKNDHRNHSLIHVTQVQSDTDSRDAPAEGLQEIQKNDALASIDGVEGHAAHVNLHGEFHASVTTDQQLDSIPHAINDPGPLHVQGDIGVCEKLTKANGDMLTPSACREKSTNGDMLTKLHAAGPSCPSACITSNESSMEAGELGAIKGNISIPGSSGNMHTSYVMAPCIAQKDFVPNSRSNLEATVLGDPAFIGDQCSWATIAGSTFTFAMPDVGLAALDNGPQAFVSQPIEEATSLPNFEPNSRIVVAQPTNIDEAVYGPSDGSQIESQAQPMQTHVAVQPITQNDPTNTVNDGNVCMSPIKPIGLLNPTSQGPVDVEPLHSQAICSSFQGGNLVHFNPHPTVIVVDSLPMPTKPTYVSEDYITDGTVEDSDSIYMPDYSCVGFNTHSVSVPNNIYYGRVSRSHSLDDRIGRDDDFRINARCGVSDSAIDKRTVTDGDGFTKVTPRKARQYHLRPRNRRH